MLLCRDTVTLDTTALTRPEIEREKTLAKRTPAAD
jgi:hypothetical protein